MKRFNGYHKMYLILLLIFITICAISFYHYIKPLPAGISYEGTIHTTDNVEFLYDLTYQKKDNIYHDQIIFKQMFQLIDEAEDFILIDMFLFNDEYDRSTNYPPLSQTLTNALTEKKKENPNVNILVITDRINTFYGSYPSKVGKELEENGIEVVYTNMKKLRDSNPVYSGMYRTFLQWFGSSEKGWLPNPFSPDSPNVTVRSYMDLLNFKANHRKIIVTEKQGIVSSANPHDGSANHSNIAFVIQGEILQDLIHSERAVVQLSGGDTDLFDHFQVISTPPVTKGRYQIQLVTEGKIKKHLLQEINAAQESDRITMGAFYLSDRDVIAGLIEASNRGVEIKLILDANKDAFGREKNGVPNRPVASELRKKSDEKISIRWYRTNGEQYHSKLVLLEQENKDVLIGGSANFTKRNIDDFNLETNIIITANSNTTIMAEAKEYFETLWTNEDALYTTDYETFADDSLLHRFLYRFQEWSGISTF
ncbi:phospholipase [bacterium LRH843]|nr:phospholipase [bacterium LRH843]